MVKHTQTIRQVLLTNCLNVFDQFWGLALKGLNSIRSTERSHLFSKSNLLENLFKIFQNRFMSILLFYTPRNIANNQMFPDVFRGLWKTNTDLKWAKYKIAKKINYLSIRNVVGKLSRKK